MCLAVPARIETMTGDRGTVALDGNRANVSLVLVPEAKLGDWVLVHAGYAITLLDEAEAKVTYDLLKQMDEHALRLEEPERD
ncbi:MAG: HypC/HybG/HupF family hydrogenase formation chaperone [Planctomycetota bacterium]|nr:HypC/HybG/HupF family hydrogenase formation chaperone [Planctomycetota bacterium]